MDLGSDSQQHHHDLEEVVADLEKLASSLPVDDEFLSIPPSAPSAIIAEPSSSSPFFDRNEWRRHAASIDADLPILSHQNGKGYTDKKTSLTSSAIDQRANSRVRGKAGAGAGASVMDDGRSRLLVHYVGGSLTFLLQIALLAWGVRQLRSVLARRRQLITLHQAKSHSMRLCRPVDLPKFASLSPLGVQKLVELHPVQHLFIDVRDPDAFRKEPPPLDLVINIPEVELRTTLELSDNIWETRFPTAKKPDKNDLLVFISTKGHRAERAALICANLGYNGCCIFSGGINGCYFKNNAGNLLLRFINRDAVATILQKMSQGNMVKFASSTSIRLIDVRRHDERALYGHILGSVHVPVEEWPKALAMEESVWETNYHFPKFGHDDLLILYSRKSKRASWAFQLAKDAGFHRCYVYKQGTFGWRLDPLVMPYDYYDMGDAPPKPIDYTLETIDVEAAELELQQEQLLTI